MSKQRRRPQAITPRPETSTPEREGPFNSEVNEALEASFGESLGGIQVETGKDESYLNATATTRGSSITMGPTRDPSRTDDWDAMKTVGEEVAHALAGGGSGQTWLDGPDDPGEAKAGDTGAAFADFMVKGAPLPELSPAFGGKAEVHRETAVEEVEDTAPRMPEPSVIDRASEAQLGLIDGALDRTSELAASADADIRGRVALTAGRDRLGEPLHRLTLEEGGVGYQRSTGPSAGVDLGNLQGSTVGMGDSSIGPTNLVRNGYGYDGGRIVTPMGAITPSLDLSHGESLSFEQEGSETTAAELVTATNRDFGLAGSFGMFSGGFTDGFSLEDRVRFANLDDRDAATVADMRAAGETMFGDEPTAERYNGMLDVFQTGEAGDEFESTRVEDSSFTVGFRPHIGIAAREGEDLLRQDSYTNLGDGLVLISTMEHAAETAGFELDVGAAAIDGGGANAGVEGYSAVVDLETPQGQADLFLHQSLGVAPQSVTIDQIGLGPDATPEEVAARVAEFTAAVDDGSILDDPPEWLTADPEALATLGEMPEFLAEQDPEAMRAAGYISAFSGDVSASEIRATVLNLGLGQAASANAFFEHTLIGDDARNLFQTASQQTWNSRLFGSGSTGSRAEVEDREAVVGQSTTDTDLIEHTMAENEVVDSEVWDRFRGDDNGGLISGVRMDTAYAFGLDDIEAAGLERDSLDIAPFDDRVDVSFMEEYFANNMGRGIPTYGHDADGELAPIDLHDSVPLPGFTIEDGMWTADDPAVFEGVDSELRSSVTGANELVRDRALRALGIDPHAEDAQEQLDTWAAGHQGEDALGTQEFLFDMFGQAADLSSGTTLNDLDNPIAAVELFVGAAIEMDDPASLEALSVLHQLEPADQTEALARILHAAGPEAGTDVLAWAAENGLPIEATHSLVAETGRFAEIADPRREGGRDGRIDTFMEEMEGLDDEMLTTLVGDFGQQEVVADGVTSTNGWATTLALANDADMERVMSVIASDPVQQLAVAQAIAANPEEYFGPDMSEEDRRAFLDTYVQPALLAGGQVMATDHILESQSYNEAILATDWFQNGPSEHVLESTEAYDGVSVSTASLITGLHEGRVDFDAVIGVLPPDSEMLVELGTYLSTDETGAPLSADEVAQRLAQNGLQNGYTNGALDALLASGADAALVGEVMRNQLAWSDPLAVLEQVDALQERYGVDLSSYLVDNPGAVPDTALATDEDIAGLGAEAFRAANEGWGLFRDPDEQGVGETLAAVAGDPRQSVLFVEGYLNAGDGTVEDLLTRTRDDPRIQALAVRVLIDSGQLTEDEVRELL